MHRLHTLRASALLACTLLLPRPAAAQADLRFGQTVTWDAHGLMADGRRLMPVMGEIHYSRVPADEWPAEVRKMRQGGVTLVATYVFWNHIEEVEGLFDWSGQRDLRRFLEVCRAEGMPVVLRIGPFCHGEARNGGIPDWMFAKGCKLRQPNDVFLHYVGALYRQVFSQVSGLQWKDGGPVLACQFDNEYRGSGDYLMALKRIALAAGFDLPFYTRTGWPELSKPVPYGEMLPLYGDYADGFWERTTGEGDGNYWKAFHFKAFRSSTAVGTDLLGQQQERTTEGDGAYPYFTCELGGGMMTAYHRRVHLEPEDAYSLAVVKLGSGSNLLGYYMYHGGTNPEGRTGVYLNETQRTLGTNHNDLPDLNYDFQAPLGEFGQRNPHYFLLRPLHLFAHDFAERLAPMEARFPQADRPVEQGIDSYLRWSYRTDGDGAFIFVNNYERFAGLTAKRGVRLEACGVRLPELTVPAGAMAVFPVHLRIGSLCLDYATAQPVALRPRLTAADSAAGSAAHSASDAELPASATTAGITAANAPQDLYLMQVPGIPVHLSLDGRSRKIARPLGPTQPVVERDGVRIFLLTQDEAGRLFLDDAAPEADADRRPATAAPVALPCAKVQDFSRPLRTVTRGAQKVAQSPLDADFDAAAVYEIQLPAERDGRLLDIDYLGDVARLYRPVTAADGSTAWRLIDDNQWNGRHFQYALWRLPADVSVLQLRILPLQADMPVYFPSKFSQQLKDGIRLGERVNAVTSVACP